MKIRYLQFSIRSLLLLTTGVAVLLTAWAVYIQPFQLQRQAMKAIEEGSGEYKTRPGGPKWLRQLVGPERFQEVIHVEMPKGTDERCLDLLVRLPRLEALVIGGKKFGDEQLQRLANLRSLKSLLLDRTAVSGSGVRQLQASRPGLSVTLGITFDDLRFKASGAQKIQPVSLSNRSSVTRRPSERAKQLVGQRVRIAGVIGILGKAKPRKILLRPVSHVVR